MRLLLPILFALSSPERQEEIRQSNAQYFQSPQTIKSYEYDEEAATSSNSISKAKYISSNTWPRSSRGRKLKKSAARHQMHGVEIRLLEAPHPLAGQLGLFATQNWNQFDVIGEYCGEVYDGDGGSDYATFLEDRDAKYSLGVDAKKEGNECRFINHYEGIAEDSPNVVMKIAYVEELPRVMVVCRKDIEEGEEFLFQYSKDFCDEYFG